MTNSWLRWAGVLPGFLALTVLAIPTRIAIRSELRWLMLAVLVGSGAVLLQSFRAERRLRRLRVKTLQLFQLLNAPGTLRDLVQSVTEFMQALDRLLGGRASPAGRRRLPLFRDRRLASDLRVGGDPAVLQHGPGRWSACLGSFGRRLYV
jgi:hypothetical protein